jgi:hypothetical protein
MAASTQNAQMFRRGDRDWDGCRFDITTSVLNSISDRTS